MKDFNILIKEAREKNNISKSELSRLIGVTPAYITMLENGKKKKPSTDILIKLSQALDIPLILLSASLNKNHDNKISTLFAGPGKINIETIKKLNTNTLEHFFDLYISKNDTNKLENTLLEKEIIFLSDPKVENTFNYSYDDLKNNGYDNLLIEGLEKSIINTLAEIEKHLNKGDIFDGVSNWISKDSPLYEVYKKHLEDNKDK